MESKVVQRIILKLGNYSFIFKAIFSGVDGLSLKYGLGLFATIPFCVSDKEV